MTPPRVPKFEGPFGGLGLGFEIRDNRSVCRNHYVVTLDGTDLCVVLKTLRYETGDTWFKLLHVDNTVEWRHAMDVGMGNGYKRSILANIYGKQCAACGRYDVPLTIDHVIPRKEDGWGSLDNFQLLCQPCNNKKDATWKDYRFITPGEIFELMYGESIESILEREGYYDE